MIRFSVRSFLPASWTQGKPLGLRFPDPVFHFALVGGIEVVFLTSRETQEICFFSGVQFAFLAKMAKLDLYQGFGIAKQVGVRMP